METTKVKPESKIRTFPSVPNWDLAVINLTSAEGDWTGVGGGGRVRAGVGGGGNAGQIGHLHVVG
jgi:hypothetical protein